MSIWNAFLSKLQFIFGTEVVYFDILTKAVLLITGSFIAWFVLTRCLILLERRIIKYEIIKFDVHIFQIIRNDLFYVLILVAGNYLVRLFNVQFLENVFNAVMIILLATPAKKILIILLTYLENNLADKTETKIDDIIFDLLNKFSGIIIYALAVVLSLDILGVNVMPFIAGAGVIGIAIGFAAKDTLSNLIAGVLLIIDRPFEIGDRIEVWSAPAGSATWGDVIDIGLRATKIQTTDNIIIIVPNNEIMMRDIINYTIITSKIRVRINIGIAYDANMLKAKDIILKVVDSIPWVLKEPLPKVVATAFGESSVDLQLRAWIDDARKRMDTISHVTDKVKEAFDKEGIKIPYPRRDITIVHKE